MREDGQFATLNISGEPIRVYVYQGRVPLHCGVCGKQLLPGDAYTRHQSPTRWSMSGKQWDDVEIGLRRTSVKAYTACSTCYGFTFDQQTSPQDTEAMHFARLDEVAQSGQLILETIPSVTIGHDHGTPTPEDLDATVRLPRVKPIWEVETQYELPALNLSKPLEALEELANGGDSWVR